jgi:hypothetical protein
MTGTRQTLADHEKAQPTTLPHTSTATAKLNTGPVHTPRAGTLLLPGPSALNNHAGWPEAS